MSTRQTVSQSQHWRKIESYKVKKIQATGGEEIYGSKYSKLQRNMKENQMGPN